MPATQTVNYGNYDDLRISVEPVDEPESVYFTDQSPTFNVNIKNTSEKTVTSVDQKGAVRWVLALGSDHQPVNSGSIDFCIGPDETHTEEIEVGLLAYEENAVLGVTGTGVIDQQEGDETEIRYSPKKSDYIKQELYTFPIWDRSHYESIHEQPKQMTKWVMFFGGITAVLAVIQIALIFARLT
jgi:hypothetical protein